MNAFAEPGARLARIMTPAFVKTLTFSPEGDAARLPGQREVVATSDVDAEFFAGIYRKNRQVRFCCARRDYGSRRTITVVWYGSAVCNAAGNTETAMRNINVTKKAR